MRLFFAVALPDDVRAQLARLLPREASRDYRFVDPEGMHVTLAFLGEQPTEKLPILERIGHSAAHTSEPGRLALGPVGSFGSKRAPRVLWIGLVGDVDRLRTLQSHLTQALASNSFPTEDRDFSPHITLARRRANATGAAPLGWPPTLETTSFPLAELTLFESKLSPRGATYTPLGRWSCG